MGAAARVWALSSPTRAPPVTRSTPSAGPTGTGAQALCPSVAIRELRQVQALPLRNQERNQARNQARSQERNPGRSRERNHPRENQETGKEAREETREETRKEAWKETRKETRKRKETKQR